jgi:argininosuccinate lyase
MLDRAAVDVIGTRVGWPEEKLRRYLDPIESVNARLSGGPAPSEVKLGIERQMKHLDTVMAGVMAMKKRLDSAREQMKRDVKALAGD